MFDAYLHAMNSALTYQSALENRQHDLLNIHTFGYRQKLQRVVDTQFGVVLEEQGAKLEDIVQPVFMKGEKMTKMSIDRHRPEVYFLVRNDDNGKSRELLTRLGDFKYTRQQRAADTYIGQPLEERVYLTTQEGYHVMGYPIGKGPLKQEERFKDPFSDTRHPRLGESPIRTDEKVIGGNQPTQYGPMVPIDLTRGENGLILDRYQKVKTGKDGVIRGLKDGVWVPLYKLGLQSVPNPMGLAQIDDTAYFKQTEQSGLREKAPNGVRIRPESIDKSNVNTKVTSYDYKKLRLMLTTALSLQRSNQQILQQFQQLLQG